MQVKAAIYITVPDYSSLLIYRSALAVVADKRHEQERGNRGKDGMVFSFRQFDLIIFICVRMHFYSLSDLPFGVFLK